MTYAHATALAAAAARGRVLPVFILDDVTPGPQWRLGGASRWWLHHSLLALRDQLAHLPLFGGDPRELLPVIIKQVGASAVYWNRCYEPFAIARDKELKASLQRLGVEVQSFNGSLLHEPWHVATARGGPFKVFTPCWRASRSRPVAAPLPAPRLKIVKPAALGDRLEDWGLLPANPNWATGWEQLWTPGENGALARFDDFVKNGLAEYRELRERPDLRGTSRLSPHLHWGEISPRQIWARMALESEDSSKRDGASKFLSEIGWREFAHHLLYHFPTLPERNWRPNFDAYPWRNSADDFKAWQRDRTGYPLVDAGMHELWADRLDA